MTFISYAQNFEDIILWRALKHIENGFYIDVGAWSPDLESVTRAFYEHGWRGINVEPNLEFHAQLLAHRTRDINLRIAISDKLGTLIMNFLSNPGLSTLDEAIAQRHARTGLTIDKQDVEVTNLATLWKQHVPEDQDVHFLKVDVEGFEEAALRGNDWTKYRPWIVVVEATLPMSQQESHDTWEPILLTADYRFAYADGLNRFYVADEHAELLPAFKYPPNFFDDFKLNAQHQAESSAQQAFSEASTAIMVERERAKWLENEWNAAKSRAKEQIDELAVVRDRTIQLEVQLRERSQALDSTTQALNQERERVKWIENEWNATKSRAEERIGELAVVRDRTIQLEVQLTKGSQELDSTTLTLIQERERAQWLENEWNAAEARIEVQAGELALICDRSSKLEVQLAERSQALDSTTQTRIQERERAQWLENEWNAAKARIEVQAGELALIRDRSSQLEVQLAERSQELDGTTQTRIQERERAQWLENEWNASKVKIDELNGNSHYWWNMADGMNHELQAMQASICWRITSPLRVAFDALLSLWALFASIPLNVMRGIRIMLSFILVRLIHFALAHPKHKAWALALLRRYPPLEAWLRKFAATMGIISGGTTMPISSGIPYESPTELSNLTPGARPIYTDLMTAMERHNKGS